MAWTPQNLTDPKFVQTQLTPLDRGNALQTMTRNLSSVQTKLAENKAALAQVEDQTNGPYSFATVRAARSAAAAAAAQGDPNAAALQVKYEELQAKRSELNTQASRLLGAVQSGEEAMQTSQTAISNLEAAGAVPPGTNQFTPPPGYNSTINPPAEVPASQNPTATPTTTTPSVQNPIPLSVNPNSDPNTNIGAEIQTPVAQQTIDPNTDAFNAPAGDSNIDHYEPTPITGADDPFEAARIEAGKRFDETSARTEQDVIGAYGGMQGLQGSIDATRGKQITQDAENAKTQGDWRVRLSLAPSAGYLYKAENPGILKYLQATDGVVFPYTPAIQINYAAHYDGTELTHSNYKFFQYKSSSIDQISLSCDFTAQDTEEANYLLAVIHFFRSVTKMFYGQDQNPKPGTPPPLCYLSGLGSFQFDRHPLVITNFSYNLPTDVDYIRAGSPTLEPGVDSAGYNSKESDDTSVNSRLQSSGLQTGALEKQPQFTKATNTQPTYVPTKISIALTCYPIVTRNDISNNFSVKEYATGKLLQGSKRNGGGIW
jgi:hypothetical protein